MRRLNEVMFSGIDTPSNYVGDIPENDVLFVYSRNRDSKCLRRANYDAIKNILGDKCEQYSFNHWAVGWWSALTVLESDLETVKKAEEILESFEDNPVVDEELYSEYERIEADETWKNCYNNQDRIEYIRNHRSQFDFYTFWDMVSVAKGEYFSGYACELID